MSGKEKTCVICGEDCSRQRRVRDKEGRYYHRECLDRAKAERRAAEDAEAEIGAQIDPYALDRGRPDPSAPIVVDRQAIGGGDEADPYALDSGAGPKTDLADVEEGPKKPCPHCNQPMPAEAMVCAKCGYNVSTGQRPVTSFAEMAAARVGDLGGGKYWPMIIGGVSILVGLGGLVYYGLQLIVTLKERGASGLWAISLIVATSLGALLGLLLLPAALGIMRRIQVYAVRMRLWATAKIVLSIVFVAYVAGCVAFMRDMAADIDATFGTQIETAGITSLIGPGLAFLGWLILWPIVLLIWLGREKVQKHIGDWR